jgi:hypothetical protein
MPTLQSFYDESRCFAGPTVSVRQSIVIARINHNSVEWLDHAGCCSLWISRAASAERLKP